MQAGDPAFASSLVDNEAGKFPTIIVGVCCAVCCVLYAVCCVRSTVFLILLSHIPVRLLCLESAGHVVVHNAGVLVQGLVPLHNGTDLHKYRIVISLALFPFFRFLSFRILSGLSSSFTGSGSSPPILTWYVPGVRDRLRAPSSEPGFGPPKNQRTARV